MDRKIDFWDRLNLHEVHESKVKEFLISHGFGIIDFGIEVFIAQENHERFRHFHNYLLMCHDETSQFLRFLPDFIIGKDNKIYLLEIKSANSDSHNLAIELEPYLFLKKLLKIGIKIFYVFAKDDIYKACWVKDVVFLKMFDNGWNDGTGSGTPYGLIDPSAHWLQSFESFIKIELGEDI